ncbi:4-galactosyl-N-acetylglucosaminide 3-alpha-L-fucosyltransferase 9-like [Hoplias malabaricus]|uniref:4-galactosyl-N-acetylglucosaminide 3-alpha-L-fucosyltransferase 9-like n=1 Tax=Hoplias malabaricus TaxID=27720 RepID=UPI0034624F10
MTSKASSRHFCHLVIAGGLLICFTVIFFVYNNPTMNWLPCAGKPQFNVCTETCLSAQIITNCSENKQEMTRSVKIAGGGNDHASEITILIWYWPPRRQFNLDSCEPVYGIKGCHFIVDRAQIDKAHAIVFYIQEIKGDLQNLLNISRPPRQKWVWTNMESPTNTPQLKGAEVLFNLTSNYRTDADIWIPYGRIVEISETDEPFQIPLKDKLVCWIVSHWNIKLKRVQYFNELTKHIKVDAYGRHFEQRIDNEDYNKVVSSCKFYLSFENSIHKDYITEKVFNPMRLGTVPVVLGPPRENYEEFIPRDSFIHVDDFQSPRELAEHLKALDQNQEMYERFFSWRKDYVSTHNEVSRLHACKVCEHIQNHRGFKIVKNITKWYWG